MKCKIEIGSPPEREGANDSLRGMILNNLPVAVALLGTLLALGVIYRDFFPGPHGLGHDYSFFLPDLLSNYYWAQVNGPWLPPWFTPAFCGGQPSFADPQSLYYSVPQLLAAYFDPVTSLFWTLQIFSALGFLGAYLFLYQSLTTSRPAAIVGAALFALNGFFSHRILVGHLSFHAIMLVPLLAWTATTISTHTRLRSPHSWSGVALGAVIVAYWVFSGMAVLLLPALLASLLLLCVYGLRGRPLAAPFIRLTASVLWGGAMCAAKVVASLAYMHQFPRTPYALGGLPTTLDSLQFAWAAVFLGPEHISAISAVQLAMSRHEFEFSVTPVAAILLISGGSLWIVRRLRRDHEKKLLTWRSTGLGLFLLIFLSIPIILNTAYGPQWEALLKAIPVIKSSSTLLRWFVIFIPVTCIAVALCIDTISNKTSLRGILASAAVLAAGFIHYQSDLRFYDSQPYDPRPIQLAFEKARSKPVLPAIQNMAVMVDDKGNAIAPLNRNDLLIQGDSSLLCYNPIFGYRLEGFPIGELHPGPALGVQNGYLNLKNPSCYLYPQENQCKPGTHFSIIQEGDAKDLLAYRSFNFRLSTLQHLANWLSLATVLSTVILFAWATLRKLGSLKGQ
jgi:hypothetical protein